MTESEFNRRYRDRGCYNYDELAYVACRMLDDGPLKEAALRYKTTVHEALEEWMCAIDFSVSTTSTVTESDKDLATRTDERLAGYALFVKTMCGTHEPEERDNRDERD